MEVELEFVDRVDSALFANHGIGVSNAPPRLSSLPSSGVAREDEGVELAPFNMPPEFGADACGRGYSSVVLWTLTTRSRARR